MLPLHVRGDLALSRSKCAVILEPLFAVHRIQEGYLVLACALSAILPLELSA